MNINRILSLLILAVPSLAYAEAGAEQARAFGLIIYIVYGVSFIGGSLALYKVIHGVQNYGELSQRDENFSKKLAMRLFMAGVLLNPQGTLQIMTMSTVGHVGDKTAHCYAYEVSIDKSTTFNLTANKSVDGDSRKIKSMAKPAPPSCYEKSTSKFVDKLNDQLAERETNLFNKLMTSQVQFLIAMIQAIGVIFYFNAWFKTWGLLEGTERQATYKGQFAVIIISSLIINLPRTAEIIINSYEKLSF